MTNHDLVAVWEEHLRLEFVARDADAPTNTMTPGAYVNHVPTMTGGVGRDELKRISFRQRQSARYRDHSGKPHGRDR